MMKDAIGAFRLDQQPAAKPFHYTMSGLDNVWLLNGFREDQTPYGRGISIEDADALRRVLAHAIVSDKATMNGKELRFLRKMMELSQHGLARLLGCSDQRIARWEKGAVGMDPIADRLTRMIVRDWLGDDCRLQAVLNELSDRDEAMHGGFRLEWHANEWRRVA